MRLLILSFIPILLGLAIGGGVATVSLRDPGPDLEWIRSEQPSYVAYAPEKPVALPDEVIEIVGGEDFDFGVMDQGEKQQHTFVLKNNSDQEITLKTGATTCKCTLGNLETDRIPPGGQGKIVLEWEAKSFDTEFRQSATIHTSSEIRPTVLLSIFGKVIQVVQPIPRDVAFSDVTVKEARTGKFTLYGFKEPTLSISDYRWENESLSPFFEFKQQPITEESLQQVEGALAGVDCSVTLKPGLPLGIVFQTLILKTNATKTGEIDIPIRARIIGDISISGQGYNDSINQLMMGPVRQDKGAKRKLFMVIKGEHQAEFEITDVRLTPDDVFTVQIDEPRTLKGGSVRMLPITVEIPPGARPVNYSGGLQGDLAEIVFVTNHPDSPEINLQMRFAITE